MIYQVSRDGDTSSSSQCKECKLQNQHGGRSHSHHHVSSEESGSPSSHASPQLSKQKHLVKLLQEQNKRLKLINEDQERQLRDLRHQLEMSKIKPLMSTEYVKSSKELPRSKIEGQIMPKMGRMLSPDLKSKHEINQSFLQIVVLQKQVKQLQLKLLQMSNKLRDYEDCCSWMQKFIISFVSMSEQLSLNYGSKVETRGLSLRKKTKICWRYMKELINYLIK